MIRFAKPLAAAAALLASSGAHADVVLFSDTLGTTLANGNWVNNSSGQIVAAPVGGGNALNFASLGSGGDLFSKIIDGTGVGSFTLKVDYLCQNVSGCAGFIGLYPGGSVVTTPATQNTDNWLVTDAAGNYFTPFTFSTSTSGFVSNTFNFTVSSPGAFGLKLEDFNGLTGVAGDAYFRNISLISAVPEPASWALMILGFGIVGFGLRRRKAASAQVSYNFG